MTDMPHIIPFCVVQASCYTSEIISGTTDNESRFAQTGPCRVAPGAARRSRELEAIRSLDQLCGPAKVYHNRPSMTSR